MTVPTVMVIPEKGDVEGPGGFTISRFSMS